MRDRKKRNIIIGSLCSLLVFMGIGYAILSQTLNISGIANMKGTWDIKITDISEASRTGKADPGTPTISTSGVSASFEANLWMPGDSITYNITVKNNGNIDAALKELVPSVENGVQQVKFSNNAVQGKVLRQSESYTFQVSVVFDENATEIPPDSKTTPPKYTISLTFVQYTGNSLYTPTNETTDNSCFVINTAGEITGYDYNCGTVVTVPAEIDGIKVKSIAKYTFAEQDSFNIWVYSKEESATLTKTYLIFKDQEARSLYLESAGTTQEELDAEENTYNYLKGDPALQNIDLGVLEDKMRLFRNANGEIEGDYGIVPLTELDLSHADYLESIDLDSAPNLKKWNLNTKNPITFKSFALEYGPKNYSWGGETVGELEELIINADVFNNTKISNKRGQIFGGTHIKKLIILDGKVSHKLTTPINLITPINQSDDSSGLFRFNGAGIENVIIDDGITELGTESLYGQDIKSITLPNTIATIGNEALKLNELTSLTLPSSIETIGNSAFNSSQITTINFESNSKLKTIDGYAFANNQLTNTGLSKLPSSLTSLAIDAFNSNNLTQITLTSPKDLPGWPNGGTVNGKTVIYER